MNGVILYADDDVLKTGANENKLFHKFNSSTDHSVLPITNLEDLEKTVSSISTFRALLLDWTFQKPRIDDDMPIENENPLQFLKSNKIYSLVYIYTRENLPEETKAELKKLYGGSKIFFEKKESEFNEDTEFEKICKGISDFETANKHMEIPFVWSQAINKSAQTIFSELEMADPNWIKEIMDTATNDGGEACSEVINIFQNILSESLIQNAQLRESLSLYNPDKADISEENTAKLYRRLFYTKLAPEAPIMTGDIFKFDDNEYGILITPECNISDKTKDTPKESYEFLIIQKDKSENYHTEKKGKYLKDVKSAKSIFNNGVDSRHILASFPFSETKYNDIALIEFRLAFTSKPKENIIQYRSDYKINAPYIHQLRQRYVAFIGRYGVPAIPDSLRAFNLK